MKKTLSLILALVFVLAVFAGCAKKAEAHTLDVIKVMSVQSVAADKELDKEAVVKAFNEAVTGRIVKNEDYKSHDLLLIITNEGIVHLFENGENKFVVSSEKFGEAYEIESSALYELYTAE